MTTTPTTRGRTPARGDQFADFSAPMPDGTMLRTRDYYMRRNLAIVFTHGPDCDACRDYLRRLGKQQAAVHAEVGEVIAVIPADPASVEALRHELDLPFPVVADTDGALHARYGLLADDNQPLAAIFVTDRYGTIYQASIAGEAHEMLDPEEVPGWLEFVACEC